jgi:hypothetical protein
MTRRQLVCLFPILASCRKTSRRTAPIANPPAAVNDKLDQLLREVIVAYAAEGEQGVADLSRRNTNLEYRQRLLTVELTATSLDALAKLRKPLSALRAVTITSLANVVWIRIAPGLLTQLAAMPEVHMLSIPLPTYRPI